MAARILAERQFKQSEDLWQRFLAWLGSLLDVHLPSFLGSGWAPFLVLAVLAAAAGTVIFLALRNAGPVAPAGPAAREWWSQSRTRRYRLSSGEGRQTG